MSVTFNLPTSAKACPKRKSCRGTSKRASVSKSINRCCRWKQPKPWSTCPARTPAISFACMRKAGDTVQTGRPLVDFDLPAQPARAQRRATQHRRAKSCRAACGLRTRAWSSATWPRVTKSSSITPSSVVVVVRTGIATACARRRPFACWPSGWASSCPRARRPAGMDWSASTTCSPGRTWASRTTRSRRARTHRCRQAARPAQSHGAKHGAVSR